MFKMKKQKGKVKVEKAKDYLSLKSICYLMVGLTVNIWGVGELTTGVYCIAECTFAESL